MKTMCAFVLLCLLSTASHATTPTAMCMQVGVSAANAVTLRDRGMQPSQQMQLGDDIFAKRHYAPNHPVRHFYRWMILFVYDMSAMDATWIRQRVETKCFQDLGAH